jgi:hypothetical protein
MACFRPLNFFAQRIRNGENPIINKETLYYLYISLEEKSSFELRVRFEEGTKQMRFAILGSKLGAVC